MNRLLLPISAALLFSCVNPGEGDRCNPLLFSDECAPSGLVCTTPAGCGNSYCCPAASTATTNPICNACPTDAGIAADGRVD